MPVLSATPYGYLLADDEDLITNDAKYLSAMEAVTC